MSGRYQEHPRFGHRLRGYDGQPTWYDIADDIYNQILAMSDVPLATWPTYACAFRCAMRGYGNAAAEVLLNLPEADKEAIQAAFTIGGGAAAQELFDALTWSP